MENYLRRYELDFNVLLDSDLKVSMEYGIYGVPTFYFLNKKHELIFVDNVIPDNLSEYER